MEDPQCCIDLFGSDPSIVYLNHEAKNVTIRYEDGQRSILKVFGSPYSPAHGFWAFGYSPDSASQLWDQVPLDSDIVITHTPAKFHRDECSKRGTAGCEVLRQTLWRVRPRLFVCGHIHEGYGVELVNWDLSASNVRFKEQGIREYSDPEPASRKQFTVDLSSRAKALALKNDGSIGSTNLSMELSRVRGAAVDGPSDRFVTNDLDYDATDEAGSITDDKKVKGVRSAKDTPIALLPNISALFPDFDKAERPTQSIPETTTADHLGTRGQGGLASSPRSDQEAIAGREGRIETCIVNAAFMATNFPHKAGKRFHKPVVIDMDLPIVDERDVH